MGHGTQISGVQRGITGGMTLISGIKRKIAKGLALVNGVQRDIAFATGVCVVTLVRSTNSEYTFVEINGVRRRNQGSYEVPTGTIIYCQGTGRGDNGVWYNGTPVGSKVQNLGSTTAAYGYELPAFENVTIEFDTNTGAVFIKT